MNVFNERNLEDQIALSTVSILYQWDLSLTLHRNRMLCIVVYKITFCITIKLDFVLLSKNSPKQLHKISKTLCRRFKILLQVRFLTMNFGMKIKLRC